MLFSKVLLKSGYLGELNRNDRVVILHNLLDISSVLKLLSDILHQDIMFQIWIYIDSMYLRVHRYFFCRSPYTVQLIHLLCHPNSDYSYNSNKVQSYGATPPHSKHTSLSLKTQPIYYSHALSLPFQWVPSHPSFS